MGNTQKFTSDISERIDQFLSAFSKEDRDIRNTISKNLPAFNMLLNCNAKTFEEFALLPIAKMQGININDPLLDLSKVRPICPKCGNSDNVIKKTTNKYECKRHDIFSANLNSISSGTKEPSAVWMQVLLCMLQFYSVKKTCDYCNISTATFYNIRNRLFYGMQLLLNELKLYGEIQADNTFIRISFKGSDLTDNDYPEDSIFFDDDFKPRKARLRGGSYHNSEKNMNSLCVFTAIDDRGHVITRMVDIGQTNVSTLCKKLDQNKFLPIVPDKDPFLYTKKRDSYNKSTNKEPFKPGDVSLFVSDGERALINFAEKIGLKTEHHVYRRKGKQMKLSKNSHNIQKINQVHKKLKDFLQKTNFVSSKYLPGYLMFFDFIENTGASDEAIAHLFEILAKPNLGVNKDFFDKLYVTPNYIVEWGQKDNPLKKFPHMQLYACYLYAKSKKERDTGLPFVPMREISKETGYSPETIRRTYKNFSSSGLIKDIINHFENNDWDKEVKKAIRKSQKYSPEVLSVYDEYVQFRKKPKRERLTIIEFFESMNKKYNLSYNTCYWQTLCKKISSGENRESLPHIIEGKDMVAGLTPSEQARAMEYLNAYEEVEKRYLRKGEPLPKQDVILRELSEKLNRSPYTIRDAVMNGRKIRRSNK